VWGASKGLFLQAGILRSCGSVDTLDQQKKCGSLYRDSLNSLPEITTSMRHLMNYIILGEHSIKITFTVSQGNQADRVADGNEAER